MTNSVKTALAAYEAASKSASLYTQAKAKAHAALNRAKLATTVARKTDDYNDAAARSWCADARKADAHKAWKAAAARA